MPQMISYPYTHSKMDRKSEPIATTQFIVLFIIGVTTLILMIRKMN